MFRSISITLLVAAVSMPASATAQHSVGPGGHVGVPHPGVGPRHGIGYGYYGPRLHLGPLPYPNRHANPTWQLHPNLYPRSVIPGRYPSGYSVGTYPSLGGYYGSGGYYAPGSYLNSGYLLPFAYDYGPRVVYVPSATVAIPRTSDPRDLPDPPRRAAVTSANIAEIEVRVPRDARVWFDGVESTLAGTQRDFATAPLPQGLFTTYEIRAIWNEDGREIDQIRRLNVSAGGRYVVDFTKAEDASR